MYTNVNLLIESYTRLLPDVPSRHNCTNPSRIPIPSTSRNGMLFQVGTLYSSVSLSCNLVPSASGSEGEHLEAVKVRRKSGSACLLMSMFA